MCVVCIDFFLFTKGKTVASISKYEICVCLLQLLYCMKLVTDENTLAQMKHYVW